MGIGYDPYLPRCILFKGNDTTARFYLFSLGEGIKYNVSGREPGVGIVLEPSNKFASDEGRGLQEKVLRHHFIRAPSKRNTYATYVNRLRVNGLVPSRVEVANPSGNVGSDAVPGRYVCRVLRDTVVDRVDSFYELLSSI